MRLRCTYGLRALAMLVLLVGTMAASPQSQRPQAMRLILKDGHYQVVLRYEVVGDTVRYVSAERDGATEEIPLDLVDLAATERWQQQHLQATTPGPVLSPELAAEEAERRSLTPEIAPNLHLTADDSILALDSYKGAPELIPMQQQGSDLNSETAHVSLKQLIPPNAAPHRILTLNGASASVQLHSSSTVFFVRVGDDEGHVSGGFVVDTHRATGRPTPTGGSGRSSYVIERLDAYDDLRIVDSLHIRWLGTGRSQPDVIETQQVLLGGGHWLRVTPLQPLLPGEYALIEVLDDHEVNLNVWDFGISPNAPESYEAIHPELPKLPHLERRSEP